MAETQMAIITDHRDSELGNAACDRLFSERIEEKHLHDGGREMQPEKRARPTCLLVAGIDGEVSMPELKKLFKPFGRVLEVGIAASAADGGRNLIVANRGHARCRSCAECGAGTAQIRAAGDGDSSIHFGLETHLGENKANWAGENANRNDESSYPFPKAATPVAARMQLVRRYFQ